MEGFVTLLLIKVEGQNLADWEILMCIFQKNCLFSKFKAHMTSLTHHNSRCILERPCNFAIFKGRSPKFCKLYYFDVFS